MARGRMISRALGSSQKFGRLSLRGPLAEFAAALYMLMVSNSDDFGRLESDALTIKYRCWPSSQRTDQEFQEALELLHEVQLIVLYTEGDKQYAEVVAFADHQQGLHKRTQSKLPSPRGDDEEAAPLVSLDNGRPSRAGTFIKEYRLLYRKVQGQPYLGKSFVQQSKDLQAAQEMCEAYGDGDLLTMAEFFLRVDPEKNPKAKFLAGKQRSLPMMKTLVGDIAKHLSIEALS
jgi:hypothetical protein